MPCCRLYGHNSSKLHILSPISDKSSLEPCSETSDNNRNNNSERTSPEPGGATQGSTQGPSLASLPGGDTTPTGSGLHAGSNAGTPTGPAPTSGDTTSKNSRRRTPNNRNLIALSFHPNNKVSVSWREVCCDLTDSEAAAHRRAACNLLRTLVIYWLWYFQNGDGEVPGSDSGISVDGSNLRWANNAQQDLEHLPFDMPKLRRRRANLILVSW